MKLADEEEISRLAGTIENLKAGRKKETEWRDRLAELENTLETERSRRVEADRRVAEEKDIRHRVEIDNREVSRRHERFFTEKTAETCPCSL